MLPSKLSTTLAVLVCVGVICKADSSHLGRISVTRLSRLEEAGERSAPYPAAGFRPEREFNLPTFQQLREQHNLQHQQQQPLQQTQRQINSRFKSKFQQQQVQPNLKYGAPSQQPQQPPKADLNQQTYQQQQFFPQQPGFNYNFIPFPQPQPGFRPNQPSQFGNNVPQAPPPSQNEDAEYFDQNEIETFQPRGNLKLKESSRLTDRESTEFEGDDDDRDTKESTTESISPSFGRKRPPQVPAAAPAPAPAPPLPALPPSFATFFPQSASGFVQPTLTFVQPAAPAPSAPALPAPALPVSAVPAVPAVPAPPASATNVFAKLQLQPASVYNFQQPFLAQQPLIQPVAQPYVIGTAAQYQSW